MTPLTEMQERAERIAALAMFLRTFDLADRIMVIGRLLEGNIIRPETADLLSEELAQ